MTVSATMEDQGRLHMNMACGTRALLGQTAQTAALATNGDIKLLGLMLNDGNGSRLLSASRTGSELDEPSLFGVNEGSRRRSRIDCPL